MSCSSWNDEDTTPDNDENYWYHHRHELQCGQIFRRYDDTLVQLDRGVPGDATQWYVATWDNGWFFEDATIEPGDLRGYPLPEPQCK